MYVKEIEQERDLEYNRRDVRRKKFMKFGIGHLSKSCDKKAVLKDIDFSFE